MDAPPRFEFTPDQDAQFLRLAAKMRWVAFVLVMLGMLGFGVAALVALAGWFDTRLAGVPRPGLWAAVGSYALAGAVSFLIGAWTFKAGKAFIRIGTTRGDDAAWLMDAVRELHKVYSLAFAVIAAGSVLLVATIAAVLLDALIAG
jgi:hypothetical protein